MAQPLRVRVWIGQRDIAVRADEVKHPMQKADSPHTRLPRKTMEREL
jgi:hypothetical protein